MIKPIKTFSRGKIHCIISRQEVSRSTARKTYWSSSHIVEVFVQDDLFIHRTHFYPSELATVIALKEKALNWLAKEGLVASC